MPSLATLRLAFTAAPWVAILILLAWGLRLNDLRDRWHHQYTAEHSARLADRSIYESAQTTAAAQNKAQVARIEQQQQRITTDAEKSYAADLARLRAELAERLSKGGTATAQGVAVNPSASKVPDATGKPDGPSEVRISSDQYVRAAETENQLEHLIRWVEQQTSVDPNVR